MAIDVTNEIEKSNNINIEYVTGRISLDVARLKYNKLLQEASKNEKIGLNIGLETLEHLATILGESK